MKYTFKTEWLAILVIILSWGAGGYFYAHFPERVVTHWNYEGVANGYSSRAMGAFLLPAMLSAMYLLFIFLPKLDPKKDRYESFARPYNIIRASIIVMMFVIFIISGLVNLGWPIQISTVTPIMVGLLFIVLGNLMGKIKQNWFVGFRMPWTLSSENVWNKTQRLGGWCMVGFGIVLVLTPLLPKMIGLPLFIAGIFGVGIIPTVYSYFIYKKEQQATQK